MKPEEAIGSNMHDDDTKGCPKLFSLRKITRSQGIENKYSYKDEETEK